MSYLENEKKSPALMCVGKMVERFGYAKVVAYHHEPPQSSIPVTV